MGIICINLGFFLPLRNVLLYYQSAPPRAAEMCGDKKIYPIPPVVYKPYLLNIRFEGLSMNLEKFKNAHNVFLENKVW